MMIPCLPIICLLALQGSNGHDIYYPSEEPCTSSSRGAGHCIRLNDCRPLEEIVNKHPLTAEALDTLRDLRCGFEDDTPKVCCPSVTEEGPDPKLEPKVTPMAEIPDVTNHVNSRLLDHQNCGPITQGKIVGGNKTQLFEFPWMALIRYEVGRKGVLDFRCGGTLINKRYVLTAAHCVTGLSGLRLNGVRIGEHDLSKEIDCQKSSEEGGEDFCAARYQDFGIETVHYHPRYDVSKLANDIALIRINGDVDMSSQSVRPICLPIGPAAKIPLTKRKVVITGWGLTESGYTSEVLLKIKIPIIPLEECARVYENLKTQRMTVSHRQICAGGVLGTETCSGDSGGPLQLPTTYFGSQSRYIQFGVVSFGAQNCTYSTFPGVYTNVAYYVDWILDQMKD